LPRRSTATLFPYTTLFRSESQDAICRHRCRTTQVRARDPVSRPTLRVGDDFADFDRVDRHARSRGGVADPVGRTLSVLFRVEYQDRKSTRLNSSHEWISYA